MIIAKIGSYSEKNLYALERQCNLMLNNRHRPRRLRLCRGRPPRSHARGRRDPRAPLRIRPPP